MSLRPSRPRDVLLASLALVWLLAAVGAGFRDWPTPQRLAEERLRFAFLLANAVDKDFRPYDTPLRQDLGAQYQELVADFSTRFGERFNTALIDRRYGEAMAGMPAERVKIVAFAGLSTAAVWWLLWTIRNLLFPERRPKEMA